MIRSIFITLLVSIITATSFSQEGKVNRISLDDVIYLAQQQSPDALIAKHRFRMSYWQYRTYKADYLPSLTFFGTLPTFNNSIDEVKQNDGSILYTEVENISYFARVSMNQKIGFTGGEAYLRTGLNRTDNLLANPATVQYRLTPVVGYNQPIFQYNAFKWDKKIEPMRYEEAKRRYLEDVEQVAITATNYFFNFLLAQIEKGIAAKNYSNYDTLYHIAKGRYNLGKIAENELLQLELNLLQAESAVDNANLNYENKLFILKSYLRIKDEELIELIPPTGTYHFDVDASKAVDEAKNNTSEGLAFERRLMEAESRVAKAKLDGRFNADLYTEFGLSQRANEFMDVYNNPTNQQQHIVGSITLSVPILDWGLARGNIKMAESSEELERTSVEQERIDFDQNVYIRVMQFKMQKKQLYIAAKSDTVAQKRFNVTQKRYMIGLLDDVLELNLAQIDNDNAKKGYYSALQTYWNSYYNLRKLTLYDFKESKRIIFNELEILR